MDSEKRRIKAFTSGAEEEERGGGYGEAEDYTGICLPGGGKEVDQEIEF